MITFNESVTATTASKLEPKLSTLSVVSNKLKSFYKPFGNSSSIRYYFDFFNVSKCREKGLQFKITCLTMERRETTKKQYKLWLNCHTGVHTNALSLLFHITIITLILLTHKPYLLYLYIGVGKKWSLEITSHIFFKQVQYIIYIVYPSFISPNVQ